MESLARLFTGSAGDHYHAAVNGSSTGTYSGRMHYIEEFQHQLQTYTTESEIGKSTKHITIVRQMEKETEI